MNKSFLILICFFYSLSSLSQDCYVKNKKSIKKIDHIQKNLSSYSFNQVNEILLNIESKEGSTSQITDIYSLIYYLKDNKSLFIELKWKKLKFKC